MKNLIEISKIVTKKKVRKIEIFDDHSLKHKNSKFNEFYEALMANKFKNDRDAASFLYDCSPTDDKYRQLKSRFRKRLLNTLFFLDVNLPSTSSYDRAYYSCNKDWTLVKILKSNEAIHTASALARQILTTALKFKFADVIVNCARILRRYAAQMGDDKNYEIYDQHSKQFQNVLDAEIRSEELYQRVIMNYHKPIGKASDLEEKIGTYCDALVGLSEIHDSPIVIYNMYLVWAYRYEMLRDFDAMLEVCNKAEKYIEDNPAFYQDDKLATFQMKKMSAYLHLRDWKNGKINAEKCLQSFPKGSRTWFSFMEYYLLLAIHTENHVNALAIFNDASNLPKFKKLPARNREKWKIYDIFLNYIIESQGDSNPVLLTQRRKNFRVARFINDPVLYPKDQRIFTVLVVIAQMLFLIEKKSYNNAAERIDRLKSYANRQLKKEEYFRTIQFIRLLQQLVKADFQIENLSNVEKYYNRLIEEPFFYRGLISELEVLPYEKLWNMILARL
ncbi:MAG: hypothetical protein P8Q41_02485 [Saprospiraceae bacterium]|jgi:hypothetical protein|nr:hypothetical protein [Saprospiraceae bacterium]